MRDFLTRLHWRLRPGRFGPVGCGTAALEALAEPAESLGALAAGAKAVAFHEVAPQAAERLRPSFELGEAGPVPFPQEPSLVPPLRIYRFRGETRIFGKGLFLRGGDLVLLPHHEFCELGRLDYPAHRLSLEPDGAGMIARMPVRTRRVEGPCLYAAQGGEGVWGHWLVDIFPRLVLGLAVPAALKVVIDANTPPWAYEMLAVAGIDRRRIIRHDKFRTTLVVDDLYVPSFPRHGNVFSPLANLAWGLLPASPDAADLRLYVSRSRSPDGSSIVNAPEIEAAARTRGYRIVHAERLDLAAKANLFSRATRVVGEFGSGMHNSVLSRAGTRVAVLQSAAAISYVQAGIGSLRGQPTGFVYGEAIAGGRRFHLSPTLFAEALDRLEAPDASPAGTRS